MWVFALSLSCFLRVKGQLDTIERGFFFFSPKEERKKKSPGVVIVVMVEFCIYSSDGVIYLHTKVTVCIRHRHLAFNFVHRFIKFSLLDCCFFVHTLGHTCTDSCIFILCLHNCTSVFFSVPIFMLNHFCLSFSYQFESLRIERMSVFTEISSSWFSVIFTFSKAVVATNDFHYWLISGFVSPVFSLILYLIKKKSWIDFFCRENQ